MEHWQLEELHLPLRFSWKIARNQSEFKMNFYVHFHFSETLKGSGEVAPNVRYGESPEIIKSQFERLDRSVLRKPDFILFQEWLDAQQVCNSLRFGLESAFVHAVCQLRGLTVTRFLHLPEPSRKATAFSLPIMEAAEMQDFYEKFNLHRFHFLKIKIGQEGAEEAVKIVAALSGNKPMMIDANEAWTDVEAFLRLLGNLKKYNILFIEQPLPAALTDAYEHLKKHSPFLLMADESITHTADFEQIARQFHGVNMKLQKAGGYANGIEILEQTRRYGLKTMIGCMVETSLGISSALNLSAGVDFVDLDSFLYLQNDPAGLVREENGELELITN
jgi:L-Ala-D/L-Glu epimerase